MRTFFLTALLFLFAGLSVLLPHAVFARAANTHALTVSSPAAASSITASPSPQAADTQPADTRPLNSPSSGTVSSATPPPNAQTSAPPDTLAPSNPPPNTQASTTALPDTLNPDAPRQLAYFSFLVGSWKCDVGLKQPDGTTFHLGADWTGRYILNGYAIADEFNLHGPGGQLLMTGMNFRSYNVREHAWNMKWLDGMTSTWQDISRVEIRDSSITYRIQVSGTELHKIRYTHISPTHFDWNADISKDSGKTWDEAVMTISADR